MEPSYKRQVLAQGYVGRTVTVTLEVTVGQTVSCTVGLSFPDAVSLRRSDFGLARPCSWQAWPCHWEQYR